MTMMASLEVVREIVNGLTRSQFAYHVLGYDVYLTFTRGAKITVALRIANDMVEIPLVKRGWLSREVVEQLITLEIN